MCRVEGSHIDIGKGDNTAACRGITPETSAAALATIAAQGGLIVSNAAGICKQVKIA